MWCNTIPSTYCSGPTSKSCARIGISVDKSNRYPANAISSAATSDSGNDTTAGPPRRHMPGPGANTC